jgi:hypothetical protein
MLFTFEILGTYIHPGKHDGWVTIRETIHFSSVSFNRWTILIRTIGSGGLRLNVRSAINSWNVLSSVSSTFLTDHETRQQNVSRNVGSHRAEPSVTPIVWARCHRPIFIQSWYQPFVKRSRAVPHQKRWLLQRFVCETPRRQVEPFRMHRWSNRSFNFLLIRCRGIVIPAVCETFTSRSTPETLTASTFRLRDAPKTGGTFQDAPLVQPFIQFFIDSLPRNRDTSRLWNVPEPFPNRSTPG